MRRWPTMLVAAVAVVALAAVMAAAQDEDGDSGDAVPETTTSTTTTTTLAYGCVPKVKPDVRVIRQADAPAKVEMDTGLPAEADSPTGVTVDYMVPETAGELRILVELDECHPVGRDTSVYYELEAATRPHHATNRDFRAETRADFDTHATRFVTYRATHAVLSIDIFDNDDEREHMLVQNQGSGHHLYAARPFCAEFFRLNAASNPHLGEVDDITVAIIGNRPDCAGRY